MGRDDDWIRIESVSIEDDGQATVHVSRVRIGQLYAPEGVRLFEATSDHPRPLLRLTIYPEHPALTEAESAVSGT
jgi:hypothetical protein